MASYRTDPALNGLSMKEVAARLVGNTTADAQMEAARMLMLGGGASMVYHLMGDADITRIMRHSMVAVASDAGVLEPGAGVPHPRGYGNNARVLGEYVSRAEAPAARRGGSQMTSLPAQHFGLAGRGVIREGAAADLVLFDAARVRDAATYERPHAFPDGMPHVLVNGTFVVRDGKATGARPGQVLRRERK